MTSKDGTDEASAMRRDLAPPAADGSDARQSLVTTIAAISGRLSSNDDLDTSIHQSLRDIGILVGADRAYLFRFKARGTLIDNTHEWCSHGVQPQINHLQDIRAASIPWFMEQLRQGELFEIDDVDALPSAADAERAILQRQGIHSLLAMPILAKAALAGFVGFDNVRQPRKWGRESIELLPISAQLIGHALERQRSYHALQLSLQRQKAILESIPDMAWLKDVDGRFIHVNEAFARTCGRAAADIVGRTDRDIWPPELAEGYRQDDLDVMGRRQRKCIEEPMDDKDLGKRVIETIKTPILNNEGQVIGTTGIARDITARKQADLQIRTSEERYRRLVESLPGIVYRYSSQQGADYWSPQTESILGFSQEDLLADPFLWHDAIHPLDLPMVDDAIAAFEVGVPINLCYRIRDAHGAWHWFQDRSIGRSDLAGAVVIEGIAFDVTAQKHAEQELRESEQRYRGLVEDAPVLICRFLPTGEIEFVNRAYCEYFGRSADQLVGTSFLASIAAPERELVMRNIRSLTMECPAQTHDHPVSTPQGEARWQRWTHRALFGPDGTLVAYQSLGEDITERKRTEALIEYQATFDELTDLPKRRFLRERLTQAMAACQRHGHLGALLFVDLDQFKNVNDSLGHPAGDALLRAVAARFKQALRLEDTLARLGGDEFLILFPELCDDRREAARQARAGAEKLQQVLSSPFLVENHELHIAASIGIALFPQADADADDTIRHADMAMYRAKEAGRNAIRFFVPSMQQAARERLKLHNAIRRALSGNELRLFFQPQVDAAGRIIGAEALLRWQNPQQGLVGADAFIAASEESGQILALGRWVLEGALRQLTSWCDEFRETAFRNVSINISARQFHQPDFTRQVQRLLGETQANPYQVTLEVTEGSLIDNLEDAVKKINLLKNMGVRFAIDDFGTGYSSLAYLKRLPLDEIKIDRSFVHNIAADPGDARLVETIITLAEQLGLSVVAEGVETAEQLRFLRARGCSIFQGFYFCRPQPLEVFRELLQAGADYGQSL